MVKDTLKEISIPTEPTAPEEILKAFWKEYSKDPSDCFFYFITNGDNSNESKLAKYINDNGLGHVTSDTKASKKHKDTWCTLHIWWILNVGLRNHAAELGWSGASLAS